MGRWILIDADGNVRAQVQTRRGRTPTADGSNPDGYSEVRVQRFGEHYERWDGRRWITNVEAYASMVDHQHADRHGAHAIAIAHATKAIEARLILAGVAIDGLLAAEARATGQDLAVLARVVAVAAAAAGQHEIERIAAKRAARAQRSK